MTADGREVVVHAVLGNPEPGEDETLAADFHVFSERGVQGTLAQRIAVPSRNLVPQAGRLSFVEAACLPTAYLTAYRMLFNRAGLRPGQSVLVQGAGGGVSTAAVLLGKAAGLVVYVTSRSEEKRAHALELGAAGAFAPGSRLPASGRRRARLGWQGDLGSLLEVASHGRYRRRRGSDERARPVGRPGTDVLASALGRRLVDGTLDEFREMCAFLEQTGVKPLVDSEYALADARAAFTRLHAGSEFGKIVVLP